MRNYEIAIVLHPDLEIDLERATGKIEKILATAKAKTVKKDVWGKRKLAYKIKKQEWGIYVFYQVSLDPANVAQIESTLRITEEVMRYLIVSLENIRYINKPSQATSKEDDKKGEASIESTEDSKDSEEVTEEKK